MKDKTKRALRIKAFLAALRKKPLLVRIPSSSEQNAEQCFPALWGD
jgi:hypothetical protein